MLQKIKNRKIDRNTLYCLSDKCHSFLLSGYPKKDILTRIADTASESFGEYFNPVILSDPDEISVNFIELLDLIVYEMNKTEKDDDSIREYIIDDLYSRIIIYLKILKGKKEYKKNLVYRGISSDDTIIMKTHKMEEYTSDLISEFHDHIFIQKDILKTLMTFSADELLNFYYQIAKGPYSLEIRTMALTGLKGHPRHFTNWDLLKKSTIEFNSLVNYVESFNTQVIEENQLPDNSYSLLFVLDYFEMNITQLSNEETLAWFTEIISKVWLNTIAPRFYNRIFMTLSNIFIYYDIEYMKKLIKRQNNLVALISLIELLPGEFFNRITVKLDLLGKNFIVSTKKLIASEDLILNEETSNTLTYLFRSS